MFQPSFRWFRIHPQKKGGKRLKNDVLNSTELYRVNRKWEFKQLAGYCNQVNMEKLLSTENGIFSFNIGHVVEPNGVDIRFIHIRIESFVCDGARMCSLSGNPFLLLWIMNSSIQWILSGWWFGTFYIHNIWDRPSHWLIFFKMVKTTNQLWYWPTTIRMPAHRGRFQPETWKILGHWPTLQTN
jgi:hypothetical protein